MFKRKVLLHETVVDLHADADEDDLMDDSDGGSSSPKSDGMDVEVTTDIRAAPGPSEAHSGAEPHGHAKSGINTFDAADEYDDDDDDYDFLRDHLEEDDEAEADDDDPGFSDVEVDPKPISNPVQPLNGLHRILPN